MRRLFMRFVKTSKLVDTYNTLREETISFSQWRYSCYANGSILHDEVNKNMRMLQTYIIPELKRRGLL